MQYLAASKRGTFSCCGIYTRNHPVNCINFSTLAMIDFLIECTKVLLRYHLWVVARQLMECRRLSVQQVKLRDVCFRWSHLLKRFTRTSTPWSTTKRITASGRLKAGKTPKTSTNESWSGPSSLPWPYSWWASAKYSCWSPSSQRKSPPKCTEGIKTTIEIIVIRDTLLHH